MAKKILYTDSTGVIRELPSGSGVTSNFYDENTNTLVVRNATFTTMSFSGSSQYGMPIITNQTMSLVSPQNNLDVVAWDLSNRKWIFVPGVGIDITTGNVTASLNSDLSGTFGSTEVVKSLTNVSNGVLPVERGGTGLTSSSFTYSGESLLLGNGANPFTLLTASNSDSSVVLASNGTSWEFITQSVNNTFEITVFTQSATWRKPQGTKHVRVLAHGAGGGGGAGANLSSIGDATGGGGGAAGGFIDDNIYIPYYENEVPVVVGIGGLGGTSSLTTDIKGGNGSDGTFSAFGNYITASGGNGGKGGFNTTTIVSGGFNTLNNTNTNKNNNLFYSFTKYDSLGGTGAAVTGSISGSKDGILLSDYASAGGGAGGSIVNSTPVSGGNGHVADEDVLCLIEFDSSGNANNIINNGITIITNNASTSNNKLISSNLSPFSRDNKYSIKHSLASGGSSNYLFNPSIKISGDFTIEFFIRLDGMPANSLYFFQTNVGTNTVGFFHDDINGIGLVDSGNGYYPTNPATPTSIGSSWTHVAYTRENGFFFIYLNGIKYRLIWWTSSTHYFNISDITIPSMFILGQGASNSLNGNICGVRISKKAVYTHNFNPLDSLYIVGGTSNKNSNALIYPMNSYYNLNINESNFSNDSHIKNFFKASGGGGGSAQISGLGKTGGNGAYGSGGGGGGASVNGTPNITQGGKGGDGYVAVISYKY